MTPNATHILLGILGGLLAAFVAIALTFFHSSATIGKYPHSPLDGATGPTRFTMMVILSTISVLVYVRLSRVPILCR